MAHSDPLWPSLPLAAWQDTYLTLHLWTQIVGKIRMTMSPPLNHWWHATLYVNARGLTTSPIPFRDGIFEIQFDFVEHRLEISTSAGARRSLPLGPISVAEFYTTLMKALHGMGIDVTINTKPQEMAVTTPFEEDHEHASYDPGVRAALLSGAGIDAERDAGIPRALHRKIQPGSFFLGQLRPGVHAILRTSGAAAQGRDHGPGLLA